MKKHDLKRMTAPAVLAAAVAAAFSLGACSKHTDDGRTVGQKVDAAMDRAETAADNAKREAGEATRDIRSESRAATTDASDKVADAAITASVNADLAKDPDLSAIKINVDTANGHVTLRGTAPSSDAKQRATRLAGNVKGVTSVDNELSVGP
jgi:osmotically-inducible protein OsmY